MDKKKRVRPTWGRVRELESKFAQISEDLRLSRLEVKHLADELEECKRIAELRDKDLVAANAECNILHEKLESQVEGTSCLVADCDGWRDKYRELLSVNATLEQSNKLMEEGMIRLQKKVSSLSELNEERLDRINYMKSRGFWKRVFNCQ